MSKKLFLTNLITTAFQKTLDQSPQIRPSLPVLSLMEEEYLNILLPEKWAWGPKKQAFVENLVIFSVFLPPKNAGLKPQIRPSLPVLSLMEEEYLNILLPEKWAWGPKKQGFVETLVIFSVFLPQKHA